ncbi:hypothetical protein [Pseudobacteriovorax antillogorgiicola]|uniref:Lipoprotein n=1 Tax=Pseudobacteriovorax antillogorgiicola TaxID=1513793 RepID=A0A1Y6BKB9_9BACT|nr:hypothetical protein [Pseudobacteriovorax antillogorgiicola]TCS56264.1 hypothetical protein EDD56_10486 [Pseudobacteriovorax antillogorgiicola]SMF07838.1 hypothetical protein SAMN06296036_104247 [Pseudobacteriovorax antillogorgiicola]
MKMKVLGAAYALMFSSLAACADSPGDSQDPASSTGNQNSDNSSGDPSQELPPQVDLNNPCAFVLGDESGKCLLVSKWALSNTDESVMIPDTKLIARLFINQDWENNGPIFLDEEKTKFNLGMVIKGQDSLDVDYGASLRLDPSSEATIYATIQDPSNYQSFATKGDGVFIRYGDTDVQIGEFLDNPFPGEITKEVSTEVYEHPAICEGVYADVCRLDIVVASDKNEMLQVRNLFNPNQPYLLPQIGFGYRLSLSTGASFLFSNSLKGTPIEE